MSIEDGVTAKRRQWAARQLLKSLGVPPSEEQVKLLMGIISAHLISGDEIGKSND